MARTALTGKLALAALPDGLNITDATYDALSTGAGNGVNFAYDSKDLIILNNTTGGAAVYTLVMGPAGTITGVGATITDPTNTVAAGKMEVLRLSDVFKQADGDVYIDCDVAGSIAVIDL